MDYMAGEDFSWHGAWLERPEFTSMGISMQERGRQHRRHDALKLLLTQSNVSFRGEFFHFDNVTIDPRPEQYFTIWIAGGSRICKCCRQTAAMVNAVLQRIARHADVFTCRASGKADWVARDLTLCASIFALLALIQTLGLAHVRLVKSLILPIDTVLSPGNVSPWKRLWVPIVLGVA